MAPDSSTSDAVPLLRVHDVQVQFGGVKALDGVSLSVHAGEVCAVIGPNGAGKTTLFNVISGVYSATGGSVLFDGTELTTTPRHRMSGLGISRTFQNVALFHGLSVLDNVLVGAHSTYGRNGWISSALRTPGNRRREREQTQRCHALLDSLGIDHLSDQRVDDLPFGTLKRVELARALAGRPRLLLLDEPAAGLTHSEVDELADVLREVRDAHELTIVVVEHHMRLVMSLSDHVVALNFGRTMADGPPREVAADPKVVEAYLGASA